jgi:nicotinamidase/pyrazinamidase
VMRHGRRVQAALKPEANARAARQRFLAARNRLPSCLLQLGVADPPFPVSYSARLEGLCNEVRKKVVHPPVVRPAAGRKAAIARNTVFWEEDAQADFMLPGGKLYGPGAEKIIPNLDRLVEMCRRDHVFLISSVDAHNPDDPELSQWPSHCLKGTPGADLIPEARASSLLTIPNQAGFALPQDPTVYQQVVLEKNTLDVFDNPNTDVLLAWLDRAVPASFDADPEFVVFGVFTEYCVRCAVEGLLKRGRRVALVTDAIESLDPTKGKEILSQLQSHGARLLTTEKALALALPLARSA